VCKVLPFFLSLFIYLFIYLFISQCDLFYLLIVRAEGYCLHFITLNDTHTHTLSRIPLDEWSARRGDLYPATQNNHKRQTSKSPAGFETAIPATERPLTHVLGCADHRDRLTFFLLLRLLPLRLHLFYCGSSTRFLPKAFPVFFFQSHLGPVAAWQFLVLTNMAVTFRTSSSHLFLSFPVGHLLPRLRSQSCFGFLLSNIPTTCSAHFHVLTRIYVTMSVFLIRMFSSSKRCVLRKPFICAGLNILQRIFFFSQNNWSFVWHSTTASMFHLPCRTTGRKTCHVIVFCRCNFIDLTHTLSSKSYSSFSPHGATRLPLAQISSSFTLGIFIKFGETSRFF